MNISRILLLLLAVVTTLGVQAQNDNFKKIEPEITYTANHQRYELGGLVIDGVKNYDTDLLASMSGLNVGQTYEVPGTDISEAVRRFWDQKAFSNVKVTADSIVGNKIYLHFTLTAHPRISSIKYTGVKKSEREDCEKIIGLQPGMQINTDLVDRIKHYIKKHFEEKGFKNCEVNVIQREDVTGDNRVLLDINIDKNEKIRVNKIFISGADPKHHRKLKKAMKKTHEKSFVNMFRSKKFLSEKYEEDKGLLVDKLNSWGYRDARVVSDSVETVDEKHVNVYLDVFEGTKYYVRNISWVGNTVYNSD